MAPMPRFVVHLRLGGVLVAAERAALPMLAGRPIAVGARADSGARVVAVSAEAVASGVEIGMTGAHAARIAPGVTFLEGLLDRHLDFAAELDALVRRHVEAVEWVGLDEAVFDVPDAARLRGLVETIRRDLEEEGLEVAFGIAASRFAALVASWLVAPCGILQVRPGYERQFLAPVALDAIEMLAPEVTARARRHGWTHLGDLASLDAERALAVFGGRGVVWREWCAGLDAGPRGRPSRPARFVERLRPAPLAPWPQETGCLALVAADALRRLLARAEAANCRASLASLRVEQDDGRPAARRLDLSRAPGIVDVARAGAGLASGITPGPGSQVVVSVSGLRPLAARVSPSRSRHAALLGKLGGAASWPRPEPGLVLERQPRHARSA